MKKTILCVLSGLVISMSCGIELVGAENSTPVNRSVAPIVMISTNPIEINKDGNTDAMTCIEHDDFGPIILNLLNNESLEMLNKTSLQNTEHKNHYFVSLPANINSFFDNNPFAMMGYIDGWIFTTASEQRKEEICSWISNIIDMRMNVFLVGGKDLYLIGVWYSSNDTLKSHISSSYHDDVDGSDLKRSSFMDGDGRQGRARLK